MLSGFQWARLDLLCRKPTVTLQHCPPKQGLTGPACARLDTQLRREGGETEREREIVKGAERGVAWGESDRPMGGGAERLRAQEANRESAEGGQCRVSPKLEVNVQGWSVPFILSVSTVSRAAQRLCLLVGLLCSFLFYKCHPLIYTIQYIYTYVFCCWDGMCLCVCPV